MSYEGSEREAGRAQPFGRRPFLSGLAVSGGLGVIGTAVGQEEGREDEEADESVSREEIAEEEPEEPPAGSPLEEAQSAVFRVATQGTFRDPELGVVADVSGTGSGFIIDPSGIAVTNNHVVTGAATVSVMLASEPTEELSAVVLGASECSDLAVIEIEGEDFSTLPWGSADDVRQFRPVYSLGFPVSMGETPQYTVTGGVVSQTNADGNTSWTAVRSVVQHDARIAPGNSGGPLVDEDGAVLGVNFSGIGALDQNFAIGVDVAEPIIDRLAAGDDHEWIGLNGTAVRNENAAISGVWVNSVESGSPADRAQLEPGDLVLSMEGLSLARDGTMDDYCRILRSRSPGSVLKIEVLRWDDQELYVGEINGDPLEPATTGPVPNGPPNIGYGSYVELVDETNTLTVRAPEEWAQVSTDPIDGTPTLVAAPDIEAFATTFTVPGASLFAPEQYGREDLEDALDASIAADSEWLEPVCTSVGRDRFETGQLEGLLEVYDDCGEVGATNVYLAGRPADGRAGVLVAYVQLVTEQDLEAFQELLTSMALR